MHILVAYTSYNGRNNGHTSGNNTTDTHQEYFRLRSSCRHKGPRHSSAYGLLHSMAWTGPPAACRFCLDTKGSRKNDNADPPLAGWPGLSAPIDDLQTLPPVSHYRTTDSVRFSIH